MGHVPLSDRRWRMPRRTARARCAAPVVVGFLLVPGIAACNRDAPTPTATTSVSGTQPRNGQQPPISAQTPQPAPQPSPPVAASAPTGGGSPSPLTGALTGALTVRGRSSTVTGTVDKATLTAYAQMADTAVVEVSTHWKRSWPRRVSIVAPQGATAFREQVGRADDLSQVAAITDGPVGATGLATSDRVILNPDAFAKLTPAGRQFVITHESTHVAVRSSLSGAAPLWLVEGFADHVGYSGSGRSRTELAAPLLASVTDGAGPTRLPTQGDFDPSQGQIGPVYLASWLAVDLIARRHGEATLQRFYEASTVQGSPALADNAMDAAFADVLGTTREAFTKQWLAELTRLAASK